MVEVALSKAQDVQFPAEQCCNCGLTDDSVEIVVTKLRSIFFVPGVGGRETRIPLPLPYCRACKYTAYRVPPGIGGRVLAWLLLCFLGLACVPFIPGAQSLGIRGALVADAALATAIMYAWTTLVTRPRGNQTSYYQPVRLGEAGLEFTNASYAERFVAANPNARFIRLDIPSVTSQGGSLRERLRAVARHAARAFPGVARKAARWTVTIAGVVATLWLAETCRAQHRSGPATSSEQASP